ncbi:MAG: Re/Si-specific NAD(P)(+) transhydrogenase subunit alpha [Longimicrobiales bacterium]
MNVVVPGETRPGERRVALVPEAVTKLRDIGLTVAIQSGAGTAAGFADKAYAAAGATIVANEAELLADGDIVLKVRSPEHTGTPSEVDRLRSGSTLIGLLQPLTSPDLLRALAARSISSFAMELVPRITRAQRMDVLSSQATVAGYKAVLLAACASGKFFPMLMTAAGTVPPARVLVLGAGVAGLQAIATARRLGAIVQGFDIRPDVKEQVESLGAQWVGIQMEEAVGAGGYAKEISEEAKRREHEHLHKLVADADVVITTAQIPGKRSPVLITEDMVNDMRQGSVIVDLAAEGGGNCALTRAGQEVRMNGVSILGPLELPSTLPFHASQMYSRNVTALLQHLVKDGEIKLDLADEITSGCLVTHGGDIVHERVRSMLQPVTT